MQKFLLPTLLAVAMLCSKARAEILLTIDITNPANVTFSTMGGQPGENFDLDSPTGLSLSGFVINDAKAWCDGAGSLAANEMTEPDFRLTNPDSTGEVYVPGKDLNLYANTQSFLASARGLNRVGDGNSAVPIVGSYEVIPEPAACVLLGAAGMLLIFRRRRTY